MSAFERQVAAELVRRAGPVQPVAAASIFAATIANRSPRWRLQATYSATSLVLAGAIVALVAGFLVTGVLPPSPERAAPGAVGTADGSPTASLSPTPSPDAVDSGFEATASLKVDPGPDAGPEDLRAAQDALLRYAAMAQSREVAEAVIAQLGLDATPERLLERISVETSDETLVLSLRVSADDQEGARLVATALGNEVRQRVEADAKVTDRALAQIKWDLRALRDRYNRLRTQDKTSRSERQEMLRLPREIASLEQTRQELSPFSSAYARNHLEWLDRPSISGQEEPGGQRPEAIPTREVMVAARTIEQGTTIEPDMLVLMTVPMDATNEMALTDPEAVIGRVTAIDILEDQPITPNMLDDG
jgi:flagella basal body P-ring formation protein FlgA